MRDTEKVPANFRDKVETIVGDVTDAEQVSNAVSNRDAVVVVLGTRNDLSKRYFLRKDKPLNVGRIILYLMLSGSTTVLSQGMRNIIDAMKAHNVGVVSVCLSGKCFVLRYSVRIALIFHVRSQALFYPR